MNDSQVGAMTEQEAIELLRQVDSTAPPQKQAKLMKQLISRHPEIVNTRAFLNWGVAFAESVYPSTRR